MELFAPAYYVNFKCIADKCRHSCCIGWEIDIDCRSAKKYASLSGGYGDTVRKSVSTDGDAHFEMKPDGRCPHLDGQGLCTIITELGEDMLCDICREHPRFYNLRGARAEAGVGAACEAAAKLILDSDEYAEIIRVGSFRTDSCKELFTYGSNTADSCQCREKSAAPCSEGAQCSPCEDFYDIEGARERIFDILKCSPLPYPEKLSKIYSEFGVSPSVLSDVEWQDSLGSLEYLNEGSRSRFLAYTSSTSAAKGDCDSLSRFLAYLVYRHTGECKSASELSLSLGFAFFAERLLASLIANEGSDNKYELARLISEEIEYSEDNVEALKLEFL